MEANVIKKGDVCYFDILGKTNANFCICTIVESKKTYSIVIDDEGTVHKVSNKYLVPYTDLKGLESNVNIIRSYYPCRLTVNDYKLMDKISTMLTCFDNDIVKCLNNDESKLMHKSLMLAVSSLSVVKNKILRITEFEKLDNDIEEICNVKEKITESIVKKAKQSSNDFAPLKVHTEVSDNLPNTLDLVSEVPLKELLLNYSDILEERSIEESDILAEKTHKMLQYIKDKKYNVIVVYLDIDFDDFDEFMYNNQSTLDDDNFVKWLIEDMDIDNCSKRTKILNHNMSVENIKKIFREIYEGYVDDDGINHSPVLPYVMYSIESDSAEESEAISKKLLEIKNEGVEYYDEQQQEDSNED